MTEALVAAVVPVVVGAALLLGAAVLALTRSPWVALPVLLDLLLAAGLLRLVVSESWEALATVAAVVAVRHLVGVGLHEGRVARAAAADRGDRPDRCGADAAG